MWKKNVAQTERKKILRKKEIKEKEQKRDGGGQKKRGEIERKGDRGQMDEAT